MERGWINMTGAGPLNGPLAWAASGDTGRLAWAPWHGWHAEPRGPPGEALSLGLVVLPEDVETKRFGWLATGWTRWSLAVWHGETEKRRSTVWQVPRLHFICPRPGDGVRP